MMGLELVTATMVECLANTFSSIDTDWVIVEMDSVPEKMLYCASILQLKNEYVSLNRNMKAQLLKSKL